MDKKGKIITSLAVATGAVLAFVLLRKKEAAAAPAIPTGISPSPAAATGATDLIKAGQGALVLPAPAVSQLPPTNGQATYGVFLPEGYGVDPTQPICIVTGRTPEAALATAQANAEMYRLSGLTYLSAKEQGIVGNYDEFQRLVSTPTGIPGVSVLAIGDWSARGTIGVVTEMGQPVELADAGAFRILVETAPVYKTMFFTDPEALKALSITEYQRQLWANTELGIIPYVASPDLAAGTAAAGAALTPPPEKSLVVLLEPGLVGEPPPPGAPPPPEAALQPFTAYGYMPATDYQGAYYWYVATPGNPDYYPFEPAFFPGIGIY